MNHDVSVHFDMQEHETTGSVEKLLRLASAAQAVETALTADHRCFMGSDLLTYGHVFQAECTETEPRERAFRRRNESCHLPALTVDDTAAVL